MDFKYWLFITIFISNVYVSWIPIFPNFGEEVI